jgi:hypothetical protein
MGWLDEVLFVLLFAVGVCISIIGIVSTIVYELEDHGHPAVAWANELFKATNTLEEWMEEGKLEPRTRPWISTHLVKLTDRDKDKATRTLRLIAGPNGWAVYQMLLVQKKSWRRFLFRK